MSKFADSAGQADFAGSLLDGELRFDLSESFATEPAPSLLTDSISARNTAAGAGEEATDPGSLAGTMVQMGAVGGLVFNITYDSSVSSAPAGFTSAIAAVVSYYTSVFNDPITINIDVGWGEVAGQTLAPGALGKSETNLGVYSYSQVR